MTNVSHIGTLLVFYYFFIAAREFSFQPSEYQEETKATGFEVQVSAIMMDGGPHHVTRPLFCPVLLKITQDPQSTTHNIIYIYIEREREREREPERERQRETETERDRDRDRQRETETERQGQEMFLAPSTLKQTRNYYTECSNHHTFISTQRSKGLSLSKMKW